MELYDCNIEAKAQPRSGGRIVQKQQEREPETKRLCRFIRCARCALACSASLISQGNLMYLVGREGSEGGPVNFN